MDFKIVEQNRPKDYLIDEKYINMINDKNNYTIDEFKIAKDKLKLLLNNYSENVNYIEEKEYINQWIIKFNDIIKQKSLEKIFLKSAFNKLKNN